MDELDATIEDLAKEISQRYDVFRDVVYSGIMENKGEIRSWLQTNKTKIRRILKKL